MKYKDFLEDFYKMMEIINNNDIDMESNNVEYNYEVLQMFPREYFYLKKSQLKQFANLSQIISIILGNITAYAYYFDYGIEDIFTQEEYMEVINDILSEIDGNRVSSKFDLDSFILYIDEAIFTIKEQQLLKDPFLYQIEELHDIGTSEIFDISENAKKIYNIISARIPNFQAMIESNGNYRRVGAYECACVAAPTYIETESIDTLVKILCIEHYNCLIGNIGGIYNQESFLKLYETTTFIPEDLKDINIAKEYIESQIVLSDTPIMGEMTDEERDNQPKQKFLS